MDGDGCLVRSLSSLLDVSIHVSIDTTHSHHSGQVCAASSRVFVQEGIYDAFMERFVAAVNSMRLGDGFRADVDQGPVVSQEHLDVRSLVSRHYPVLTPRSASSITSSPGSEKEPVS